MTPEAAPPEDHGIVTVRTRARYLWAWIFPAIAAAAAVWLVWNNWATRGPEITITFTDAPGVQAGKTALFYRGVQAGEVTAVRLEPSLHRVLVSVRLEAFAAGLAREGSEFWIEQPVLSLRQITGIEALIQGNSIQARAGNGPPASGFVGLDEAPLRRFDAPELVVSLHGGDFPLLDRGTPLLHRGVPVGSVQSKSLDEAGEAVLDVVVDAEHARWVRTGSRFWVVPAASLELSGRGISVRVAGLDSVIEGAIAFDDFSSASEAATDGARFDLFANEALARAEGPPVKVVLPDAAGMVPGVTPVEMLGKPCGVVESVRVDPRLRLAEVTVRLEASAAPLATANASFSLVQPRVSPEGISGLETLLTGPFLRFDPGAEGTLLGQFVGRVDGSSSWLDEREAASPLRVRLVADRMPGILPGAPVFHRGLVAGRVLSKSLATDQRTEMAIELTAPFAAALRAASRFWRTPATSLRLASGVLEVQTEGLLALLQGGVSFDNFGGSEAPAAAGDRFELHDTEALAAAVSPPIHIRFPDAMSLSAGRTELRYLGHPVGIVESVALRRGRAEVTARLRADFDFLRRTGSTFAVVRPTLSLSGLSGLETLLSGVFIACIPGPGPGTQDTFLGTETASPEIAEKDTFRIAIVSPETAIRTGAPVLFRETPIGTVLGKELTETGVRLSVGIEPEHSDLIREKSRFLDASGSLAKIGPFAVRVPNQSILDLSGRIDLVNPRDPGPTAPEGSEFPLDRRR